MAAGTITSVEQKKVHFAKSWSSKIALQGVSLSAKLMENKHSESNFFYLNKSYGCLFRWQIFEDGV